MGLPVAPGPHFSSASVNKRPERLGYVGLARHNGPIHQHGNDGYIPLKRGFKLKTDEVCRNINPGERLLFQYTTSSSSLQKKLGVA